ncbi:MAG: hypothetical protein DRJ69_06675, partial [Thermoprotei archaeon]
MFIYSYSIANGSAFCATSQTCREKDNDIGMRTPVSEERSPKALGLRSEMLDAVERAANWVISQAEPEAGGYKWACHDPRCTSYYSTSYGNGATGIGLFLLSLYLETGNDTYLEYAESAARWLISRAVPADGGYKWPFTDCDRADWYLTPEINGASGVGLLFVKLHELTKNETYLEYAEGAVRWMIAHAVYEHGGFYIPYNPDYQASFGNPGPKISAQVGDFLLNLYRATGNPTYIDYCKGLAQWLLAIAIQECGGYKWCENLVFHPNDFYFGNVGLIAKFLYNMYRMTGNTTYLEYANGALNWIVSNAVIKGNMAKWQLRQGYDVYCIRVGRDIPTVLHYGSVGEVLLDAYEFTGNTTFLAYALKHARWMMSLAIEENCGYAYPEKEGDDLPIPFITSFVLRFLARIYNITGDGMALTYMERTFTWLINNATIEDGGYKWP